MIETKRLTLRDILDEDLPFIFQGLSDPEVFKYYGVSFSTLEETMGQMQWYRQLDEQKTGKWWAICARDSGIFYGAVGFNDWTQEHRKAEIGYWLLVDYWGKGIVTEAVKAAIEYAQEEMNLHRIEAFIEPQNLGSLKLVEKLGFHREGRLKDYEMKNGQFIDFELYAFINKVS